jgi:hypothetical protein
MIPVLGTASLGDAIEFTGGPGFDPRFGPERSNFFCPAGLHATQDPPYATASREAPLCTAEPRAPSNALAVGQFKEVHETPVARLRTRLRKKNERAGPPLDRLEKYKPPKNLVLKVRKVLIFKVVVLPITFGRSVRERRLHL